jgi:hypothetical protein
VAGVDVPFSPLAFTVYGDWRGPNVNLTWDMGVLYGPRGLVDIILADNSQVGLTPTGPWVPCDLEDSLVALRAICRKFDHVDSVIGAVPVAGARVPDIPADAEA